MHLCCSKLQVGGHFLLQQENEYTAQCREFGKHRKLTVVFKSLQSLCRKGKMNIFEYGSIDLPLRGFLRIYPNRGVLGVTRSWDALDSGGVG